MNSIGQVVVLFFLISLFGIRGFLYGIMRYGHTKQLEQLGMVYYHTINTENKINNQINGISPFNPELGIYKEASIGLLGYSWNLVSNEILYWTGN